MSGKVFPSVVFGVHKSVMSPPPDLVLHHVIGFLGFMRGLVRVRGVSQHC